MSDCGDISAKVYYFASCMFRDTFEVKCPLSDTEIMLSFILKFKYKCGNVLLS